MQYRKGFMTGLGLIMFVSSFTFANLTQVASSEKSTLSTVKEGKSLNEKGRILDLKEFSQSEAQSLDNIDTSAYPTTVCENMYQDPFNGTSLKTDNWHPQNAYTKVEGDKLVHTYKTSKKLPAPEFWTGNKYFNFEYTGYKKLALNTNFVTEVDLTSLITSKLPHLHEGGIGIRVANLTFKLGLNSLKETGYKDGYVQLTEDDSSTNTSVVKKTKLLENGPQALTLQFKHVSPTRIDTSYNIGDGYVFFYPIELEEGNTTNKLIDIFTYSYSTGVSTTTVATNKFDNFTFACSTIDRDFWKKTSGVTKTPITSIEFQGRQYQFMADSLDRINSRSSNDNIFDGTDTRENWAYDLAAGGPGGSTTKQVTAAVHNNQLFLTMVSKAGYIYTKKLLTVGTNETKPTWEATWYRNTLDTVKPPVAVSTVSYKGNLYHFVTSAGKKHYFRKSADGKFDAEAEYKLTAFSGASVLNNTQFTLAVDKLGDKLFVVAAGDSGKHYIQSTVDGVFDGSAASEKFVLMPTSILFAQTPTLRSFKGRLWEAARGTLYNNVYTRSSADGVTWTPWASYGGTATGQIELGASPANDELLLTMKNASGSPYNRRYFID